MSAVSNLSHLRFFGFIVMAVLLQFMQQAQAAEDKKLPALPTPLENLVAQGAQIRYLGNDGGLDGWVVLKNGEEQYFYVTPDRQAIVTGILFNNKGDAVTLRQVNQLRQKEGPALDTLAGFIPAEKDGVSKAAEIANFENPQALAESVSKSKSEQLYEAVMAANSITLGSNKNAPVIYTFIDPECPHCHDMVKDVRESGFLEKGDLQVKIIPVGLISETSLQEAAYLLAAPNPQELLFKHLDGEPNVLLADPSINTQGVQRNMALMQDWKFDVTPFSIYRDASGKVKILRGRPNNLKKVVAELR